MHVAKIMTYPEQVSRYNIEKLRQRVRNGPDVHPGANLIRQAGENSFVKSLAFGDRERAAQSLRIGDIVERHMEDGDVVLFNRQPSLHKLSIMSHHAKVMPWRTFRFNICVCAPYNADFDGDEMNMHLPQTEEARSEAKMLMGVHHNLATPRNGEPLVAASQDFLSAAYLITQRDQFFSKDIFCSLVAYFGLAEEEVDVPIPAILKPVPLWTGKQVFTCIIKPNRYTTSLVNFEMKVWWCALDIFQSMKVSAQTQLIATLFSSSSSSITSTGRNQYSCGPLLTLKEKNYDTNKKMKHFCPNDGWVAFRSSELISGNIAKKTIGDGSKTGLLYVLLRDCGAEEAAKFMDRFSKLCSRYFGMHKGFSMGISDVSPSAKLKKMKYDILSEGYRKVISYHVECT